MIISHNEVAMDPVKVKGIQEWPVPKKLRDVQSFLGFCNFYRRFIAGFSEIAKPLTELTKKNEPFEWTEKRQQAFEKLKEIFTTTPVLIQPNPEAPYRVITDASDYATGACLLQPDQDNAWRPVSYLSKAMTAAEQNYPIYDKELLAVIHALDVTVHPHRNHCFPYFLFRLPLFRLFLHFEHLVTGSPVTVTSNSSRITSHSSSDSFAISRIASALHCAYRSTPRPCLLTMTHSHDSPPQTSIYTPSFSSFLP